MPCFVRERLHITYLIVKLDIIINAIINVMSNLHVSLED